MNETAAAPSSRSSAEQWLSRVAQPVVRMAPDAPLGILIDLFSVTSLREPEPERYVQVASHAHALTQNYE